MPLPTPSTGQTERVDSGKVTDRAAKPTPSPRTDRVEVSKEVEFVNTVVQATHDTPAVREDKVAAAKKAIADGTLGRDAGKLADALIDHMLDDKKS
jgi:flagellar biosynthesis anti-sigma factor FlgM